MDWSLVLVSQGIESTIEYAEEDGVWRLLVDGNNGQRALQALRQYRVENRTPTWRQQLRWTGLIFDWRSVAWFLLLAVIFLVGQAQYPVLTQAGMMDRQAVWAGQWWRLFTAVTLHRDLTHLISNLTAGVLLLGLAMGSFGSGLGLLAAYVAGVGGNVAGLLLYSGRHPSLGASGMIFGALGLLAGQTTGLLRVGIPGKQLAVRGLLSGFLLLVLFGLNPESDVIAHTGGFLAGVLLGGMLAALPHRFLEDSLLNRLAEVLCAAMVILTWCLALAR
jgi:membrane associated rhomboid family serine protease